MAAGANTVRIEPRSVLGALARMRECSREYSAAAGRLGMGMPPMPPACLLATELALERATARLIGLAVRADVKAVVEEWRVSCLLDAGAGDVGNAARDLFADLSGEGRRLIGDLQEQPGITIDPLVAEVHVLSGDADALGQDWKLLEFLGHLEPTYQALHPVEAATARQQLLAMGLNIVSLSPEWATIDPVGHQQAATRFAAKAIDARDLGRGDVSRWVGHIGTGLVLGLLMGGPEGEAVPASAEAATPGTAGEALNTGVEAFDQLNRVPTDGYPSLGDPAATLVGTVGQAFRGLFGATPRRRTKHS